MEWEDVGDFVARLKASQVLRDVVASQKQSGKNSPTKSDRKDISASESATQCLIPEDVVEEQIGCSKESVSISECKRELETRPIHSYYYKSNVDHTADMTSRSNSMEKSTQMTAYSYECKSAIAQSCKSEENSRGNKLKETMNLSLQYGHRRFGQRSFHQIKDSLTEHQGSNFQTIQRAGSHLNYASQQKVSDKMTHENIQNSDSVDEKLFESNILKTRSYNSKSHQIRAMQETMDDFDLFNGKLLQSNTDEEEMPYPTLAIIHKNEKKIE